MMTISATNLDGLTSSKLDTQPESKVSEQSLPSKTEKKDWMIYNVISMCFYEVHKSMNENIGKIYNKFSVLKQPFTTFYEKLLAIDFVGNLGSALEKIGNGIVYATKVILFLFGVVLFALLSPLIFLEKKYSEDGSSIKDFIGETFFPE